MSYSYATFDQNGRCVTIMRSMVSLDLPNCLKRRATPDDIYMSPGGRIMPRKQITISVDREFILPDGQDTVKLTGVPKDAILIVSGQVGGPLTMSEPGAMLIETTGKYRSNLIGVAALPLEALQERFRADVDRMAGEARAAYVTDVPGQAEIYRMKEAEARAFQSDPLGNYPLLGNDPATEAAAVIARADECRAALADIEAKRMSTKRAISEATDVPAILAAMKGMEQ